MLNHQEIHISEDRVFDMEKSTMKNTSSEKTQQLAKGFLSNNRFFMGIKGVHEHIAREGTFNPEKSATLF